MMRKEQQQKNEMKKYVCDAFSGSYEQLVALSDERT